MERFLSAPEFGADHGPGRGEEAATAFLAARLARFGFEPAGRPGWFLPVAADFESAAPVSSVWTPAGALRFGEDFVPFPESAAGTVEGRVDRMPVDPRERLPGRVVLLEAAEFPVDAVRDAAARGASAVLVRADARRLTMDRVLLTDGGEFAGIVEDRGTEFGFTSYPDGASRVLSLSEVREIRLAVPPGPLAPVRVFERLPGGPRAAVPVVALSSRAAVREGDTVRIHVSFRSERIVRRHVAGRLPGHGSGEVRLTARLTRPTEVAAALGAAAAAAGDRTPGRPLLVLFLSASESGEPESGEVRPAEDDAVEAARTTLSTLRTRRLVEPDPAPPVPPPAPAEPPPASSLDAAREERAAGRLVRAARAIDGALEASPGDRALLLERGRIRLATGDFAGVEEAALDLARRFPEDGTAHLLRAEAAFAAGLEEDGARALDRAALARHPEALLRRARRSLDEAVATDEIQSDLQTVLGENREAPAGVSARGALLLLMGRAPEASELLSRALAEDPGLVIALLWRADALIDLGRPEAASADLSRAWSLGLREPSVLFQRGICGLRLRQYTLAIRDFTEYAKVRPGSAAAVYNIACAHALAGSPEEALYWLGLAVEAGFRDEAHARTDPDLASLWGDPRFSAIFSSAERE
ncbi:MAG: tetratricopeptide repeat protein [Planctomycetes bacterium]|nr:tetratricopeptide repeat protein [Planctomycetota bacterium]